MSCYSWRWWRNVMAVSHDQLVSLRLCCRRRRSCCCLSTTRGQDCCCYSIWHFVAMVTTNVMTMELFWRWKWHWIVFIKDDDDHQIIIIKHYFVCDIKIILYYITSHHVTSCHVTLRYITLYYIILYNIISYHIISYHIISYYIILHTSHHVTSCHVTLRYITLHYIILYHIISNHITLYYWNNKGIQLSRASVSAPHTRRSLRQMRLAFEIQVQIDSSRQFSSSWPSYQRGLNSIESEPLRYDPTKVTGGHRVAGVCPCLWSGICCLKSGFQFEGSFQFVVVVVIVVDVFVDVVVDVFVDVVATMLLFVEQFSII